MFLIDTNIFLELMLDQERADECERFLEEVKQGRQEAIITDLVLDSILLIMESKHKRPSELAMFLISLADYKGLQLYWLSVIDRAHATEHMDKLGLDFEDSTLVEVCKRLSLDGIVSFDRHFNNSRIRKLEPKEIVRGNR